MSGQKIIDGLHEAASGQASISLDLHHQIVAQAREAGRQEGLKEAAEAILDGHHMHEHVEYRYDHLQELILALRTPQGGA